jgi:hypothetical protein
MTCGTWDTIADNWETIADQWEVIIECVVGSNGGEYIVIFRRRRR